MGRRDVEEAQFVRAGGVIGYSRFDFRLQLLLRLAILGVHLAYDQEEDESDHGRRESGRDDQEAGLFAPIRKRGVRGRGCDQHDREMAERAARA